MRCADKRRELAAKIDAKKLFQVQARRIMETAAKKIKMLDNKWIIKSIVDKVDNFFDFV